MMSTKNRMENGVVSVSEIEEFDNEVSLWIVHPAYNNSTAFSDRIADSVLNPLYLYYLLRCERKGTSR